MTVPVHIIAGFLGTGKTTAIRAQLDARQDEKLAVIVNDFGEASLDEATLSGSGDFTIQNIPGGCVCCTAPEGFIDALGAVLAEAPDRLIIEPTGLARPQDIVDTLRRCPQKDELELAPVVVLVDPGRIASKNVDEQELIELQAGVADILVANRTDLCSPEVIEQFDSWVDTLWPQPLVVHKTSFGRIPSELMEWPEGEGARLSETPHDHSHAHDHGDSSEGFDARSFRWAPDVVFSAERLGRAVLRMQEGLAGADLARFKGIFRTQEGFVLFEVASGTAHQQRSAHRRDSRADVIVSGDGDGAYERIANWVQGAILTSDEIEATTHQIEIALPDGRVRIVQRADLAGLPDGIADVGDLFPKRAGSAARLAALWDSTELPENGSAVICAWDGFASEPVPVEALKQGVLIHTLGGEPLPKDKGGPFRLMIPENVPETPSSCANVKGVVRVVIKDD
jgi:G3E family GTPase